MPGADLAHRHHLAAGNAAGVGYGYRLLVNIQTHKQLGARVMHGQPPSNYLYRVYCAALAKDYPAFTAEVGLSTKS